jgi:hypothetical protein
LSAEIFYLDWCLQGQQRRSEIHVLGVWGWKMWQWHTYWHMNQQLRQAVIYVLYPTYPICAKWVIVTSPQFLFPFVTLTNKFSFWANFNMNVKHIWGHFDP